MNTRKLPRSSVFPARRFLLAALLLVGALQQQVSAANYSWVNAKITDWSDTTAWAGGLAPATDLNNVLTFSITQNSTATNNLGTFQLNRLVGTNTSSSNKTLTVQGAGNPLNFVADGSSTLPTMAVANNSVSGSINITIPFTVTDALTITNSGARGTTISGAITNTGGITFDGSGAGAITFGTGATSGAGGITISGSYNVNMNGNNTYDGLTDVQSGRLTLNRSGGTIKNSSAVQVSGGELSVAQADTVGAVTLSSGTISGAAVLTGSSFSMTNSGSVSAVLDGAGATLTKTGAGIVTLSGNNTYTGATTVTTGTLLVAATGQIASGSAVAVGTGAAIGGDGTINGNLTLDTGAKFVFDLNNTPLTVGGTFALNSSFGVDDLVTSSLGAVDWSTVDNGTYKLIGTSFSFNAGNIENFGIGNAYVSAGKQMYFANGSLDLVVVPEPATFALLAFSLTTVVVLRRRRA